MIDDNLVTWSVNDLKIRSYGATRVFWGNNMFITSDWLTSRPHRYTFRSYKEIDLMSTLFCNGWYGRAALGRGRGKFDTWSDFLSLDRLRSLCLLLSTSGGCKPPMVEDRYKKWTLGSFGYWLEREKCLGDLMAQNEPWTVLPEPSYVKGKDGDGNFHMHIPPHFYHGWQ